MLIDGRTIPDGHTVETAICIIGAGAAGIAIALELAGGRIPVVLLESGGFDANPEARSLNQGESTGRSYFPLEAARLRLFGGTTNHWGGWCKPLDDDDLTPKAWVPDSGWPIDGATLAPYYARANGTLRLGPEDFDPSTRERRGRGTRLEMDPDRMRSGTYRMHALRMGPVYRKRITEAANITTYLHSNVIELEAHPDGRTIAAVKVGSAAGNRFRVRAGQFVLAVGGIENARVLLASCGVHRTGMGNQHDLVGRYFMEHLELGNAGEFVSRRPVLDMRFYFPNSSGPVQGFGNLALPEARREEAGILNFGITLRPKLPRQYDEMRSLRAWESLRSLTQEMRSDSTRKRLGKHLRNVLRDMDRLAARSYGRLAGSRIIQHFVVKISSEQAPNRDSRVMLGEERDQYGVPRVRLHWTLGDIDFRTIQTGAELIARELGRAGEGRMRLRTWHDSDWQSALVGGFHHMGTTRMARDPRRGVVDADCRVHGIANLYIAGSSVFPTGGYANPTLTLVALAVRLADHLRRIVG